VGIARRALPGCALEEPFLKLPYDEIGGDGGMRELVDRFYHAMDAGPEAREVRALHQQDLAEPRGVLDDAVARMAEMLRKIPD